MAVTYRLAKGADVPGISEVFADSINDLYRRTGVLDTPVSPKPPNPVFGFLIRKTPDAFWVAEEHGRIIGYSDSFVRGTLWYFSWLFIAPGAQGKDVGRSLLERTLYAWRDVRITNRATITFASNPVSQSLYMRYQMYPREPAYYAEATSRSVLEKEGAGPASEFEEARDLAGAAPTLRELDRSVLGFPLEWTHDFLFETKARCLLFRDRGVPVGYAYVRGNGAVGPMAVSASGYSRQVLETALRVSAAQGVEKVRFYFPGSNRHAVDLAARYRMKIEPLVFMSTEPFAKWENYVFHSAALM